MTEGRFAELLHLYLNQKIDVENLEVFLMAAADPAFEHLVKLHLGNDLLSPLSEVIDADEMALLSYTKFKTKLEPLTPAPVVHRVSFLRTAWFKYAAAVLILLSIGSYFWVNKNRQTDKTIAVITVPKGGTILTLADGSEIILDSLGNGIIANENGAAIQLRDGQLAYNPSGQKNSLASYNTMTTPRGRQFTIILPDGTKVWLNSASSLRYPTVFSGRERKVDISGEAYFEVAKNTDIPFVVNVNNKAEIQVLGTEFNVNTYTNEPSINTSLLSGSIRINYNNQSQVLQPGQQAQMASGEKLKVVNNADMDKVVAWKNGYFNFNNADIFEVMRQLERWYDIEVVYNKSPRPAVFNGDLQRDLSFEQITKVLRDMEIHFKMEGRKLIIEP